MCGICGFIGQGTVEDLKRMNDALTHRGPDASGIWVDPVKNLYIGHKRLSIIDPHDGAQPMWTSDKSLCITFNGEIYNHQELRTLLEKKGYTFISDHSDTEVLLHGYREWGSLLPSKLNGMWAFAIYDVERAEIFVSRDRFGKKPFYYYADSQVFMFSSELSSLRKHSLCKQKISTLALKKFFAYNYIPAPLSLYEHVYKLPAGHNLIYKISDNSVSVQKYWEFVLEPFDTVSAQDERSWCEQLRALICNAVKRRMISDVPLGIFLSGGIDSSSIAYFASQLSEPGKLKTFSIGFEEPSFDESRYALLMAQQLKTDHHHKMLALGSGKLLLGDIAAMLDEPLGDSSLLPTYLLCKECKTFVTVALGGDGADELFAGYDPFKALRSAELYGKFFPKPMHNALKMIIGRLPVSHVNMSLDFKLKRTLRGIDYPKKLWNSVWLGALAPQELNELFNDKSDLEEIYSEAIDCWDSCKQSALIDKTLQFYTRLYLQNDILTKVDRASMMNSLEVRAPYLDIELVDFVRKIPSSFKFRNGQTKYILKKALEPLLPKEILYRSKKGFGVPVGKWFRNGDLKLSSSGIPSILHGNTVKKLTEDHLSGKTDNRSFLWNMWLLESFVKSCM